MEVDGTLRLFVVVFTQEDGKELYWTVDNNWTAHTDFANMHSVYKHAEHAAVRAIKGMPSAKLAEAISIKRVYARITKIVAHDQST